MPVVECAPGEPSKQDGVQYREWNTKIPVRITTDSDGVSTMRFIDDGKLIDWYGGPSAIEGDAP
jgi:hypothetical protein